MSILDPLLIDSLGDPVTIRNEDAIEASLDGAANSPYAEAQIAPLGWNHGGPDSSRMVGWTLRRGGKMIAQHAFSINPQAITRSDSPRNQMFATQGGFYVDDFGPGPTTIQLTQLVAHGRATPSGGGGLARATMREDVLRWYDNIYTQATSNPGRIEVWFHDNHLWNQINGKTPELVYFPPQSVSLVRSVQQHNVWQLQVTMLTLTSSDAASRVSNRVPGHPKIKVHVVRKGETLHKIAAHLAGKHATHKRILQLQQQIVALTKKYGQDDITKNRKVNAYSNTTSQTPVGTLHVTRMHVAPGERIILPGG